MDDQVRIVVFGWYNHGNVGDESFIKAFRQVYPQHDFTFTDHISQSHIDANYDLCIIGGGDIINKSNLQQIIKLSCPKIAMSVTVTKLSICEELKCLDMLYVRDHLSLSVLHNNGFFNSDYIPDIALCLTGNKENGKSLIANYFKENHSEHYKKVCTVVVNGHLWGTQSTISKFKNVFFKHVDDLVDVMDSTNMSFLFVPFSIRAPWDDRVTNSFTSSQCKFWKKNCVIYDKLDVQSNLDIIAASDLIISSRFHGAIFGLGCNVPTVMISSHDKTSGFLNTINTPYADYWTTSYKEIKRMVDGAYITDDAKNTKIDLVKYNEIRFLQ